MAIPYLTEEQIRQIRHEWDTGRIDTRQWAEALDVSMETIRRIGRRDTYRKLAKGATGMRARPQVLDPMVDEPREEDKFASIAKVVALVEKEQAGPKLVNALLDEMKGERRNATLDSSELAFGDPGVGEAGERDEG